MSFSEIFFLAMLGLIVFGPKKLASIGQQAGQMIGRFKKISRDFTKQLEQEVNAAAKVPTVTQPQAASVAMEKPAEAKLLIPSTPALEAD
jgi:sec-independent protein translocase protein TatB